MVIKDGMQLDADTQFIVDEFLNLVNASYSSQVGNDELSWVATSDGIFSVKSCYNLISKVDSLLFWSFEIITALAFLWGLKASSRILIFGWRLIVNRLLIFG